MMRTLPKAGALASLATATLLAFTMTAHAQTTTNTDPNATTDTRTINGTDDYRNDGPDLGWLGLLGLAGLLGLRRRPVTHDRDLREGRPAHAR
jgi:MYXO-CTERM domain-containing protein